MHSARAKRAPWGSSVNTGDVGPMVARFAVVGDLQETSWLEFWRESNAIPRDRLIQQVAASNDPLVVLLGDLVFDGASAEHWSRFDEVISPLRDGREILSLIGNHEYLSLRPGAPRTRRQRLAHLERRFPGTVEPPCRVRRIGGLALVMVDSSIDWFEAHEWGAQLEAYQQQLHTLDADPDVGAVIVFTHHPPYTNSRVTGDERHVQQSFDPPFTRASKTQVMVSGHVHSYERFHKHGKTYVVSGGGGGPRVRRHAGPRRRHEDALATHGDVYPLHWLRCTVHLTGYTLETIAVDGEVLDTLRFAFATRS
jgi:hypothetical protein